LLICTLLITLATPEAGQALDAHNGIGGWP
jgi:hypothetical protein